MWLAVAKVGLEEGFCTVDWSELVGTLDFGSRLYVGTPKSWQVVLIAIMSHKFG